MKKKWYQRLGDYVRKNFYEGRDVALELRDLYDDVKRSKKENDLNFLKRMADYHANIARSKKNNFFFIAGYYSVTMPTDAPKVLNIESRMSLNL